MIDWLAGEEEDLGAHDALFKAWMDSGLPLSTTERVFIKLS